MKNELTELSMLEMKREGIVAVSEPMRQCLRIAHKLANIKASNILILGESGTGKGLLAKFIHQDDERPFVQINCAALPESLLEAELFGYEKGAFTGASDHGKVGLFELAQGGTIFLDEIGELPLSSQAKLLKYLDDHEVVRIGGTKPKKIDCMVVAATNRDLEELIKSKKFRQDLFYRLNTFTIRIPALRERPEDIFELINFFLQKYNRQYQVKRRIVPEAYELLQTYSFPGNIRELNNLIQKVVVMSENDDVDEQILKRIERRIVAGDYTDFHHDKDARIKDRLAALEKEIITTTMSRFKSTREMARHLGMSQPTVVRKMKKYGFKRT
jgi:transcriptional regulator with PAS, ATPase and Fis domain